MASFLWPVGVCKTMYMLYRNTKTVQPYRPCIERNDHGEFLSLVENEKDVLLVSDTSYSEFFFRALPTGRS